MSARTFQLLKCLFHPPPSRVGRRGGVGSDGAERNSTSILDVGFAVARVDC